MLHPELEISQFDGGEALRDAAGGAGNYDWIVFTSVNAVERFMALVPDTRALAGVGLGVVGPATARALAARGLVADLVAADHSASGLVDAMAAVGGGVSGRGHDPHGAVASDPVAGSSRGGDRTRRSVLFPKALEAHPVLADGLRRQGWEVTEVDAYRTVTAGPAEGATDAALDAAAGADVVTFTSPSTVRGFLELSGGRRRPPVVACIGPVTAEAAREAGLAVDVVSEEHSAEGLVAALCAAFGAGSDQTGGADRPPRPGRSGPSGGPADHR